MTLSFRILLKLNIMDSQKAKKLPHDIGGGESYEVERARAVTGHVAEDSVCAAAAPRFRVKYRDMDWRWRRREGGGGAFLTAVDVALFPDRCFPISRSISVATSIFDAPQHHFSHPKWTNAMLCG